MTEEQKREKLQSTKMINSIKLDLCTGKGDRIKKLMSLEIMCKHHRETYDVDLFPKEVHQNGYKITWNPLFKEWKAAEQKTGAGEYFKYLDEALDHAARG